MQATANVEKIARRAGSFTERDAFRVLRRHEAKARQLGRHARRSLKAAALAAFIATAGGAANAAETSAPLPPIPAAMFDSANVSKQKWCGQLWREIKPTMTPAGHSWRTYSRACFAALKGKKGPPRAKRAAAAICSTDSDCERVTGRPMSLAPASPAPGL